VPDAVIFDLDGVLLDSEQLWNLAKEEVTRAHGGRWLERAARAMMGMSSPEWTGYMRDELGVPLPSAEIDALVIRRLRELYRTQLPLIPGAVEAVRACAARWPVGLASSSNREIIDLVLPLMGLADAFAVTVSSEEVARGKPAPDVYVEAARRMNVHSDRCVAIEDSSNGIRSAVAAGMRVIAVPNAHYPPEPDALALADVAVATTADLTPELVGQHGR
jgi:HAD superfamily hydrolase (TIGR01509 family)